MSNISAKEDLRSREHQIADVLIHAFQQAGWHVASELGKGAADMIIRQRDVSYVVEIKVISEGRADRLVPLWSQAYLQAMHVARGQHQPLAIVAAPTVSEQVASHVIRFAESYAPHAGVGVVDLEGLRRFAGVGLEGMNTPLQRRPARRVMSVDPSDLFSDLNQWMLKVLLAPELPERFLSAPRAHYPNSAALAEASGVSTMTTSRFLRQLDKHGYLDRTDGSLQLVRRQDLFEQWKLWAAARPVKEVPMKFLFHRDRSDEWRHLLHRDKACLGLFAAADTLHVGFVDGVPPYIYVRKLDASHLAQWKNLVPAQSYETPDVIVRQAQVPESVFRGAVQISNAWVSDIVQVWLDVALHPTRGQEQAEQIWKRVLNPLAKEQDGHG